MKVLTRLFMLGVIFSLQVFGFNCNDAYLAIHSGVTKAGTRPLNAAQAEALEAFNSTFGMNPASILVLESRDITKIRRFMQDRDRKAEAWLNLNGVVTETITFSEGTTGIRIVPVAGHSELNDLALARQNRSESPLVYCAEEVTGNSAAYLWQKHVALLSTEEIKALRPLLMSYHEGRHADFGYRVIKGNPSVFSMRLNQKEGSKTLIGGLGSYETAMSMEEVFNWGLDVGRGLRDLNRLINEGTSQRRDLVSVKKELEHSLQSARLLTEAGQKWTSTAIGHLSNSANAVGVVFHDITPPGKPPIKVAFLSFVHDGIEVEIPIGPRAEGSVDIIAERGHALKELKRLQEATPKLASIYEDLEAQLSKFTLPDGPSSSAAIDHAIATLEAGDGLTVMPVPMSQEGQPPRSASVINFQVDGVPQQIAIGPYDAAPYSNTEAVQAAIAKLKGDQSAAHDRASKKPATLQEVQRMIHEANKVRRILQRADSGRAA